MFHLRTGPSSIAGQIEGQELANSLRPLCLSPGGSRYRNIQSKNQTEISRGNENFESTCQFIRLRGGKRAKTDIERRDLWYKKFPLGMKLYDACGGVVPGPGDEWYEDSNITLVNELIERGASVNFAGKFSLMLFCVL